MTTGLCSKFLLPVVIFCNIAVLAGMSLHLSIFHSPCPQTLYCLLLAKCGRSLGQLGLEEQVDRSFGRQTQRSDGGDKVKASRTPPEDFDGKGKCQTELVDGSPNTASLSVKVERTEG